MCTFVGYGTLLFLPVMGAHIAVRAIRGRQCKPLLCAAVEWLQQLQPPLIVSHIVTHSATNESNVSEAL
jgi:hypothetical protein